MKNHALTPPVCRDCIHCHTDRWLLMDRCTRVPGVHFCNVERQDSRVFAWLHDSCGRGGRHFQAKEEQAA